MSKKRKKKGNMDKAGAAGSHLGNILDEALIPRIHGPHFWCGILYRWKPVGHCKKCKKRCRIRHAMVPFWEEYMGARNTPGLIPEKTSENEGKKIDKHPMIIELE